MPRVLGPHDEEHVLRLRHLVSEDGHLASDVVLALLQGEGRADTRGEDLELGPRPNLTSSSLHMAFTELCSIITFLFMSSIVSLSPAILARRFSR